jgi:mono/diheme cytochrome c family protein
VHCRGTARRWAALAGLDAAAFGAAARAMLDATLTRERFELAESVELTISPWQWRQWIPDATGGLANPALFQTIDVARVNAPGSTRDAFLGAVAANRDAIAARTWVVPTAFRSPVAEVQPNAKATLPQTGDATLDRALGMIGCPACHTDDADFVQTNVDRTASPFYDKELDARTERIDALARGGWPGPAPFGPLQPLP